MSQVSMRRRGVAGTAFVCLALAGCGAEIGPGVGDDDVVVDAGDDPADAAQLPDAPPIADAAPPDAQPCVGGDDQAQDPETGACYILVDQQRYGWDGGRTACEAFGADLVRIDDQAENDLVFDLAAPHVTASGSNCDPEVDICDFWAGASDQQDETIWLWHEDPGAQIDNPEADIETPLFSQWREGEPNDAGDGEDCMILEADNAAREWDDRPCDRQYPIICERL